MKICLVYFRFTTPKLDSEHNTSRESLSGIYDEKFIYEIMSQKKNRETDIKTEIER